MVIWPGPGGMRMQTRVVSIQKYQNQNKRWGLNQSQLYKCDLYKLILQFVKRTKELRLDPFDRELTIWVEELATAVTKRCSNKDLVQEARDILDHGIWSTYKSKTLN
tara:strand:- start:5470 stop:5790 length:321 start_codon:yes stop_codon:yes gene_type:complete